jgi:hypothetical protein
MGILTGALIVIFIVFVVSSTIGSKKKNARRAAMTPEQRVKYDEMMALTLATLSHGKENIAMLCPHCQERGQCHTKSVVNKKGISGGKATGALLTGGISLLATGLSRKESGIEAYCRNCKNVWSF